MNFQSVKGFKDVLSPDSEAASVFEELARRVLDLYGYRELRLPTVEFRELYVKSTGETSDIVEKEMFELEDAGGRKLALRPEGTPGAVRAFLQHHMDREGGKAKLFYIGSMFRAERPQAGRFREFGQVGAECFGHAHPAADAELILALAALLDGAGLAGKYTLDINNIGCDVEPSCRPAFRRRLKDFLNERRSELCEHCQRRLDRNPLRVLDCKADGPKLKDKAPKLEPCGTCRAHGERLAALLTESGLAHKYPVTSLVRGLDYYNRTVFEFRSSAVGAQDAIAGGGRYDGLVKSMGGPDIPAVGWALGIERTLMAAAAVKAPQPRRPQVFVAVQDKDVALENAALLLLRDLRAAGISCESGFEHSLKSQLREANRLGVKLAVIFGKQEFDRKECIVKDMGARDKQETTPVAGAAGRIKELVGQ